MGNKWTLLLCRIGLHNWLNVGTTLIATSGEIAEPLHPNERICVRCGRLDRQVDIDGKRQWTIVSDGWDTLTKRK